MISTVFAAEADNNFDVEQIEKIESELVESGAFSTIFTDISTLLNSGASLGIVDLLFFLAGGAFTIYMLFGGITLMTSSGDPKKVAEAKQTITNAFVGLLIVIFAYWIVEFLGLFLGLDGFSQSLGS